MAAGSDLHPGGALASTTACLKTVCSVASPRRGPHPRRSQTQSLVPGNPTTNRTIGTDSPRVKEWFPIFVNGFTVSFHREADHLEQAEALRFLVKSLRDLVQTARQIIASAEEAIRILSQPQDGSEQPKPPGDPREELNEIVSSAKSLVWDLDIRARDEEARHAHWRSIREGSAESSRRTNRTYVIDQDRLQELRDESRGSPLSCWRPVYEGLVDAIATIPEGDGFKLEKLLDREQTLKGLSYSQIRVALRFLVQRKLLSHAKARYSHSSADFGHDARKLWARLESERPVPADTSETRGRTRPTNKKKTPPKDAEGDRF